MDKKYIDEKDKQIHKENKKYMPIFMIILLAAGLLGFFVGRAARKFEISDLSGQLESFLTKTLIYVLPVMYVIMILILAAVCIPVLIKQIKKARVWDGEDEEYIEKVEKSFSNLLNCTAFFTIASFGIFFMSMLLVESSTVSETVRKLVIFVDLICLVCDLVFTTIIQSGVIKNIRMLNPEKRGNIFALNFRKKWEGSCDEAEQYVMYKASYKSCKVVNTVCMWLMIITFLTGIVFKTGIMPVFCIAIIWTCSNLSFVREVNRLEK